MSLHGWTPTNENDDSTWYIKFMEGIFICLVFSATYIDPKMIFFVTERHLSLYSVDADSSFLKAVHRWQGALGWVSRLNESRSYVSEISATFEQSATWHFKCKPIEVSRSVPLIGTSHSSLKARWYCHEMQRSYQSSTDLSPPFLPFLFLIKL